MHRITGQDKLFDTLFAYENYPVGAPRWAATTMVKSWPSPTSPATSRTHYPLTVQAMPAGKLSLRVEYDTDVFDAAAIETLVDGSSGAGGDERDPRGGSRRSTCSMPMSTARLDAIGHRAVLTDATSGPSAQVSIPELFAAQVERAPAAMAVTFGELSMTYRELDDAANRLAHLLVAHGVGAGESVALLFSRSADAIVSILGGASRGGLPADRPGRAADRLAFMLAMPRRSSRSPPVVSPSGSTDWAIKVIAVDNTADPAIDSNRARRYPCRPR